MIIGIDFSINSTAITIKNNSGDYQWFVFVPNYKQGKKCFKVHENLEHYQNSRYLTICSYEKETVCAKDNEQQIKMKNANHLSDAIVSVIVKEQEKNQESITQIYIEGYSFASNGKAFIDLVTFNTFLKVKLIQNFGYCLSVIPPTTIKKKFTGKGNASKCEMTTQYLNETINKEKARIFQTLLRNEIPKWQENDYIIPKPFDDIIDSIAILESFTNPVK